MLKLTSKLFSFYLIGYFFHNLFTNFLLSVSTDSPCGAVPGAFDQIGERYICFVYKNHYACLKRANQASPPPLLKKATN